MVTKKWTVELRGIRDILRLGGEERYKFLEIAESLSISHQTVSKHVATVHNSGLDFAQALELSDQELKALIYPKTPGPLSEGKVLLTLTSSSKSSPITDCLRQKWFGMNTGSNLATAVTATPISGSGVPITTPYIIKCCDDP